MTRAARIEKYLPLLPPSLKILFDAELAAGNELNDIEIGFDADEGKIYVVVNYPFRANVSPLPAGVLYREFKDRDPMLFEFYMPGGNFSLIVGKFKPMKLDPLPHGPESPNEAHGKYMDQRAKELEVAAAERAARAPQFAPLPPPLVLGSAGEKFIASMKMTFDMWHDGLGYDLDAATPAEQSQIEALLLRREPRDWRDIEALARIDSPGAQAAVKAALKSKDPHVRREAMRQLGEDQADPKDREKLLLAGLQSDDIYGGLSQAIDEAAEFHPPAVIDLLFRGALHRPAQTAVLFAGLLYFIHGKSEEAFDWNHRPFFLRFDAETREARKAVFVELCETCGIDPKKYR